MLPHKHLSLGRCPVGCARSLAFDATRASYPRRARRVARLKEAASARFVRVVVPAARPQLVLVEPSNATIPTLEHKLMSGDCGKTCPRGGALFEVGELKAHKLFHSQRF